MIRSASSVTGAMPTAASTRPQFASDPNSAVLTRLSRATTRAAVERVVLAGRAGDGDDDPLGDTFGVGLQLCAQVVAHSQHGVVEIVLARRDLACARGQQQHGVVGRAAAVDVEAVEGARRGGAQRLVQRGSASATASVVMTHSMVASDGASMPAPLAMPPTVHLSCVVQRNLFGHRVGGHDGPRGLLAAGQSARHLVHDLRDTGQHLVHRQPVTDQPGGADRDLDRAGLGAPVRQRGGDGLRGGVGVLEARGPVQALAPPELRIDRTQPPGGQHLLGPQHRCGLDLVAGEHARRGVVGALVEHQREVQRAGGLDTGGDPGGPETGGRGARPGCAARSAVSRRHPHDRKSFGLRPAQREVHRLHGRSSGALDEVVDGGDRDERLASSSTATASWAALLPITAPVFGSWPSGSRCTKGSSS